MTARRAFILILIAQMYAGAISPAQSSSMIGRWKVNITFGNGEQRLLRFDAQGGGKGTLLLLDPKSQVWGPATPSEAKWTQEQGNSVTFSGDVEFPIGNVGRDPGTLEFKGKFEPNGSISGEATFSPLVGDGPSKSGAFKAVRDTGG